MKNLLIFSIAALILQSCASSKNSTTQITDPKAPKEAYSYNGKQVEKYLSTISVPFEISMTDVEKQINNNVKELIFEDNSMDDNNFDNFMCRVTKKQNISVTAENQSFVFNVPLKIWVKVGYKVMGISIPAQELNFEMNVKFGSQFSISPNWEANVKSYPIGYEWVKKPTIRLAGVDIPVGVLVEKALNSKQDAILKSLDEAVRKNVEIKKYVIQAWNTASQPYLLSEKYRTWLKVTPVDLVMTPITTVNNKVKATIGIHAYTETITGGKPVVQNVSAIPDLKPVPSVPEDFQVAIISDISLTEATKLTADTLVGQKFSFKEGKYNVEVTGVDIYGNQDKMIIKAGLKGSLNGNIYYKGIPAYNPANKTVYLENFDYDLETKNILIRTANWILQGKLGRNMKEALTFQMGGQIDEIKKQIQANLSNNKVAKGIVLNGKIEELSPDKVYLTPNSIIAVILAKGKLNLQVDGLD
ncbi:DUF4403 family protein [Pseudarcicella hirudinis]|nr:DUF4403 family protein [Pseudarcicella hirudinis]